MLVTLSVSLCVTAFAYLIVAGQVARARTPQLCAPLGSIGEIHGASEKSTERIESVPNQRLRSAQCRFSNCVASPAVFLASHNVDRDFRVTDIPFACSCCLGVLFFVGFVRGNERLYEGMEVVW